MRNRRSSTEILNYLVLILHLYLKAGILLQAPPDRCLKNYSFPRYRSSRSSFKTPHYGQALYTSGAGSTSRTSNGLAAKLNFAMWRARRHLAVIHDTSARGHALKKLPFSMTSGGIYLGLPSSVQGIPSFYVFTIHYPLATGRRYHQNGKSWVPIEAKSSPEAV